MATPPDAQNFPTVAVYSDSIGTGFKGTSHPRNRWTSRVCDTLLWREVNLSINGMGYVRRRGPWGEGDVWTDTAEDTALLDALLRIYPFALVISLGGNDTILPDTQRALVRDSMRRDFQLIHDTHPDVPVLVAPYNAFDEVTPSFAPILDATREACVDFGFTYSEALATTIHNNPVLLCDDGIHPNDAGHAALAEAILPDLRALRLRAPLGPIQPTRKG